MLCHLAVLAPGGIAAHTLRPDLVTAADTEASAVSSPVHCLICLSTCSWTSWMCLQALLSPRALMKHLICCFMVQEAQQLQDPANRPKRKAARAPKALKGSPALSDSDPEADPPCEPTRPAPSAPVAHD